MVTASTGDECACECEEQHRPVHGNFLRARPVGVDHGFEVDRGQARQDSRVMAPEMADPDDGDAKRIHAVLRPTMAMPAASADLMIDSPSIISVLPASTDNSVAPAARMASIVATPMTGTSNRMS